MAKQALDHVCNVWDIEESPLRFGHHYKIEEFISHSAAQKDANGRMYAYNDHAFKKQDDVDEVVEGEFDDIGTAREGANLSKSKLLKQIPRIIHRHNIVTFAKVNSYQTVS